MRLCRLVVDEDLRRVEQQLLQHGRSVVLCKDRCQRRMRLHSIQKLRHRPVRFPADGLRQPHRGFQQVGLRQAVQCAVRFERAEQVLREVGAGKRLVRVDPRVQVLQQSLPRVDFIGQTVHEQKVRALAVEEVHQKLLVRLFSVLHLIVDEFDLIFGVQGGKIADGHGKDAAAAARDADGALFRELALHRRQPEQRAAGFPGCGRGPLEAKVAVVSQAAEIEDIPGVQAGGVAGEQLRDGFLGDRPAEKGIVGTDDAVIGRLVPRVKLLDAGAEQVRHRAEAADRAVFQQIEHLFLPRPRKQTAVLRGEKAGDGGCFLLPEKHPVQRTGKDAGTIRREIDCVFPDGHCHDVGAAGQRGVQPGSHVRAMERPLGPILPCRFQREQPLPVQRGLHDPPVRRDSQRLHDAAAVGRVEGGGLGIVLRFVLREDHAGQHRALVVRQQMFAEVKKLWLCAAQPVLRRGDPDGKAGDRLLRVGFCRLRRFRRGRTFFFAGRTGAQQHTGQQERKKSLHLRASIGLLL